MLVCGAQHAREPFLTTFGFAPRFFATPRRAVDTPQTGTPVCKHPRLLRFQRARLSLRRASFAPCGRHRVLTRLRCAQASPNPVRAPSPFARPSLVLTSKVMSTERSKTIINSQPLVRKDCGKLNSVLHYEPYNLRNCCLTNNALTSSEGNSVTLFIANTGATRPRISAL